MGLQLGTIVMYWVGTTKKITFQMTDEELIHDIRSWAIEKSQKSPESSIGDLHAIYKEFEEWIEMEEGENNIEILTVY